MVLSVRPRRVRVVVREPAVRWLVTSAHLQPRHHAERAPWGVVHAARDDTRATACGLSAATWFVFWELEFNDRTPQACRHCAYEIAVAGRA